MICIVKAFDCVDQDKLWKILKEMGPDHLPASWEICMQVKKQQLELYMEQQTGSKSEKEYVKAGYCHPDYLDSTYRLYHIVFVFLCLRYFSKHDIL